MAKKKVHIEGIDEVLKNLNREIADIKDKTLGGLLAAGFIILRESSLHVPVEYGNLRGSGYVRRAQSSMLNEESVEIGYTAAYALWVHENIEMKLQGQPRPSGKGVYWGPDGHAKFLERALMDKSSAIIAEITKRAKRK